MGRNNIYIYIVDEERLFFKLTNEGKSTIKNLLSYSYIIHGILAC